MNQSYKNSIPEIANRIKYCVTTDAVVEFFKAELQLAYEHGYQDGYVDGHIDGQIDEVKDVNERLRKFETNLPKDQLPAIPNADRPEIAGESRLHPIFENILAATRMGRI